MELGGIERLVMELSALETFRNYECETTDCSYRQRSELAIHYSKQGFSVGNWLHFTELLAKDISKQPMLSPGKTFCFLQTDHMAVLIWTISKQLTKCESQVGAGLDPSPLCDSFFVERRFSTGHRNKTWTKYKL